MKLTDYEQPSVTTDIVIFSIINNKLNVLLVKRGEDPFKDQWALPGGFVRMNESLEEGAARELKEETGISKAYLEQLYTFGDIERDPRGRVLTVAYMALIKSESTKLEASTDVTEAKWFSIKDIPKLAFDHTDIINYAVKRLRWKFEYTPLAFSFLEKKFTLSQLKQLYDIVFATVFDKRNFYKKIGSLEILEEVGVQEGVPFRPAKLYSLRRNVPKIINLI